jgi:membrane-associated phospholipid phosphatase
MSAIGLRIALTACLAAASPALSAQAIGGGAESPAGLDTASASVLATRLPQDLALIDFQVAAEDAPAAGAGQGSAPRTELPFSPAFFRTGLADVRHVFTAPARWDEDGWRRAGLYALAVVATGVALDEPVRDAVGGDPDEDFGLLSDIERFGTRSYTLKLLGGVYLVGALRSDENVKATALDGLISAVIAHGLITSPLKRLAGRARPFQEQGADAFAPLGDDRSFPSGHTTEAFAVASVIAAHSDKTWVKVLSYGLAGTVGYARLRHDVHWTSDVLAGAMIGTVVGREVVAFNRGRRAAARAEVSFESDQVLVTWRY